MTRHRQIELICQMLVPAFGDHPPADIDGINVPTDLIQLRDRHRRRRPGRGGGGAAPRRAGALGGGGGPGGHRAWTQSAMAVVADRRPMPRDHARTHRCLTVADTEYGRISFTTTTGADGKEWLSIWPTTPSGLRRDLADLLAAPQLV